MSYMADRDHIAITSGDASTTRRKFLYRDVQLRRQLLSLRVSLAILIVASRQIREYCPVIFARRLRVLRPPAFADAPWTLSSPAAPGYSVRPLEFSERAPPAMRAHVHGDGEFALPPGHPVDSGTDLGHGLVTAECVVAGQVH
jgi:hypothetical protein